MVRYSLKFQQQIVAVIDMILGHAVHIVTHMTTARQSIGKQVPDVTLSIIEGRPKAGIVKSECKVRQFNSWNGPVKAKFAYLCTSGCYHLRNTILVKLCIS
jgi:hypothetical protein